MLCRTASDLYWLSRHVERLDNTARLLDLAHRIALLPDRVGAQRGGAASWGRALDAMGLAEEYARRHGALDADRVARFLILDETNSSSIRACVHAARESGRAQRGAITAEMYEDLNASWLRLRDLDWDQVVAQGLPQFLDWVKRRSGSFRGTTLGTMARNEGYEFLRLGTFVERADFGVRLLDIQFGEPRFGEPPEARSAVEYYQLSALLQALSAFESFRRIYKDVVTPARVAELMILRADMPRSLAMCTGAILSVLEALAGRGASEAVRQAGMLAAGTRYARIDEVFGEGIHHYLARFMSRLYRLTDQIGREFIMSTDVVAA
jgi:uncharacterized alpha-E superfamily protein